MILNHVESDVQVEAYFQDADSFGWAVYVLFTTPARRWGEPRRWGVLDALAGTACGAGMSIPKTGITRTIEQVVVENFWLVDWYDTEELARAAFAEAGSRVW